MTNKRGRWLAVLMLVSTSLWTGNAFSCDDAYQNFVFSWPVTEGCGNPTRGGTTVGAPTVESEIPHDGWLSVQEPGLSNREKDRRAILAMAGGYKVTFDFLEVVGFESNFSRDKPYHSWGTEYVYVVENQPEFISLQHIMVMRFRQENGEISAPFVMKHWRQDWSYESKSMLVYDTDSRWQTVTIPKSERKGAWVQSVYQVDDSPRYASYGYWQHNTSFSSWVSQTTNRPLPRRESSVRDDYDLLEGFNRHTISQYGWTQEEENWKKVSGETQEKARYLSKEIGVARYRAITDYDFSLGDQYLNTAGEFWKDVRDIWREIIREKKSFTLHSRVNGAPMFVPLFGYAENIVSGEQYNPEAGKIFVKQTIDSYIAP